jgi:hypothetical protein
VQSNRTGDAMRENHDRSSRDAAGVVILTTDDVDQIFSGTSERVTQAPETLADLLPSGVAVVLQNIATVDDESAGSIKPKALIDFSRQHDGIAILFNPRFHLKTPSRYS